MSCGSRIIGILLFGLVAAATALAADRPNVLFITVDDMNWDSVGAYGCQVDDITPNIDKLASQGMRFQHAHVTIAICQPTRAVWMTGRYPHNSGALGFDRINKGVPTLVESLRDAGYYTGLFAKTGHVVPSRAAAWNERILAKQLRNGRSPDKYYEFTKAFLANAKDAEKPFFLMANAQDPHRPFAGSKQEQQRKKKDKKSKNDQYGGGFPRVSRTYKTDEIVVPAFLPDIPEVRQELSEYFTSVHRADEVVGAVLKALDKSGLADDTLVMFMSDHGMPLPFAKTNVWYNSTRTPWIVRWPDVVKPNSFDKQHFISGIDFTPTVLDALALNPLEGMDGRSFLPVLKGKPQDGRDFVFTHINRIASKKSYPMRSIQTAKFGYIYNAWSDGKTIFKNESQSGLTFKAMQAAAKTDDRIAARVKHFVYRTKEEFYDYENDPNALHNLIDAPNYADKIAPFRARMLEQMEDADDYLLKDFRAGVDR
jgi:N-sulfoglucosamine sulfohydrolase